MTLTRSWWLLIAIVAGIIGVMTWAFWHYTQDDVFITFTYSRNIAEGVGFVFNPGERVQGTTTPLWALVMAGVYTITPELLHAGNLIAGMLLLLIVIIVRTLLRNDVHALTQVALVLLIVSSPIFYISYGMETLLYCTILVTAWLCWVRDRRAWAMLAAAALTWTRADGVVLGGTFGLLILWDAWRSQETTPADVIRLGALYVIGITPWFLFALIYFGSLTPNTFSAKAEILEGVEFIKQGWTWRDSLYGNNPLHFLAFPLIVLGVWRALITPHLRPIALWTVFFLAGYTVLNTVFFWYYTPLVLGLLILTAIGADWLARRMASVLNRQVVWAGMSVLVLISAGLGLAQAYSYREPPPRMTTYERIGSWIDQQTPADSTIVVADLGIVGYHAQRQTWDSFGLIVPDMYHDTPEYAAIKYKPDYVVATTFFLFTRFINEPWFGNHFVPDVQISTAGDTLFSPMTVYRLRLPLETPSIVYQGMPLPLTCVVEEGPGDILPGETFARLYDTSGELVRDQAQLFLWHRYPAAASLGDERLIEQMAFPTTDLPPGDYTWEMDCDTTHSGAVTIAPLQDAPDYLPLDDATWPGLARLQGLWLPEGDTTWSGGSVLLALDWEALDAASTNMVLNVEVIDESGAIRTGFNAPSLKPAQNWEPGDRIGGEWRVNLPPDLPAGEYGLQIGWFDPETNERQAVGDGDTYVLPLQITNQFPGGSGRP